METAGLGVGLGARRHVRRGRDGAGGLALGVQGRSHGVGGFDDRGRFRGDGLAGFRIASGEAEGESGGDEKGQGESFLHWYCLLNELGRNGSGQSCPLLFLSM